MEAANGRSDLIVGISGDVFHEEIDQARIALKDLQDLKRAITGLDFWLLYRRRNGNRLSFREAKVSSYILRQNT